jgi:3-phenylpropionate/trans-cinnamate dioxygenase ferredoxin component
MNERTFITVAAATDLPPGEKLLVAVAGKSILLCHTLDRIFAVINKCSHAEEPLAEGQIRGCWIACPTHGARFDLETGEAMYGPAKEPIETFAVRVVEDMIEIEI